jgi:hypothetical protein
MADTFTNRLRLRKIESGTRTDAWGDTFNEDVLDRLDDAISGIAAVSSTGGSSTLSAEDGATDEARCSSLQITGTLASNATIVIPNEQKLYLVRNETTGSFTLTIKTSSGTGITITQGAAVFLQCDGSNGVKKVTPEITISTGAVAGGIDIVVDTTPQLGGDLDANGHNIGFDDGTGILDDDGNEQLIFQKTASAVNQLEVTNAATGNAPSLGVAGGDTNIDLLVAPKGSGKVRIGGNLDANGKNIEMDDATGILDDSGNEQLIFQKTASAVNQLEVTNAATGNAPQLGAAGDDTNIDLLLAPKGSGLVKIGSNRVIDASVVASDTVAGVQENATEAEQETGTATDKTVTPGTQQFHASAVKAYCRVASDGTLQSGSYNVASSAKTGTGVYTVTLTNALANTNYTPILSVSGKNGTATNTSASVIGVATVVASAEAPAADAAFALVVLGELD